MLELAKKKLIFRPAYFALQWHITERCNWHCRHCYQRGSAVKELPLNSLFEIFQQYLKLIHDLGTIGKKRTRLTFTGGEPFLREDFFLLLEKLHKYNRLFFLSILCNGSFIDVRNAQRLKKLGVGAIQLSLEGMMRKNDAVRGPGAFQQTIEAARLLIKAGIAASISFTLTKENQSDLAELIKLCEKIGIARLGIRRFIPLGRGLENEIEMLSPGQLKRVYKYIEKKEHRLHSKQSKLLVMRGCEEGVFAQEVKYPIGACAVLEGRCLVVLSNGDVVACRRLPLPLGNVLKQGLRNIYYGSNVLGRLRNLNNAHPFCQNCKDFSACLSGAKCVSLAYFGNPYAPDPQCWKLFKSLPSPAMFRKEDNLISTRNNICPRLFGGIKNALS